MADPFVAEIRMFPFNFPPKGWAFCDGQIMPISQNTALFALIGTTYGGDGRSTFGLPNLRGRAPMHPGQGPGLAPRVLGETGGSETVTLLVSQIPAHTHTIDLTGSAGPASASGPDGALPAATGENTYSDQGTDVHLAPESLSVAGGSQPHNNMQPYLTLYFAIALQGVFPSRW